MEEYKCNVCCLVQSGWSTSDHCCNPMCYGVLEPYITLPKPKIVCLCGSTRFKKAFEKAQLDETLACNIVLTVGSYTISDDELFADWTDAERLVIKAKLDALHTKKIDLCDEVFVLNVDGYIGSSTALEIKYAKLLGKPIRYLEAINA